MRGKRIRGKRPKKLSSYSSVEFLPESAWKVSGFAQKTVFWSCWAWILGGEYWTSKSTAFVLERFTCILHFPQFVRGTTARSLLHVEIALLGGMLRCDISWCSNCARQIPLRNESDDRFIIFTVEDGKIHVYFSEIPRYSQYRVGGYEWEPDLESDILKEISWSDQEQFEWDSAWRVSRRSRHHNEKQPWGVKNTWTMQMSKFFRGSLSSLWLLC